MLRNTWIVLGAFAPISVFVITAFATEELQNPVTLHEEPVGRVGAITWTVCSSGCDFTSIQTAVDAASDGDTIELGSETFYESVEIQRYAAPSNLTIRGQDRTSTVVDGGAVSSGFIISTPTHLANMTIRNAVGGVLIGSSASLTKCSISGNQVGLFVALDYGNEVSVTDTTISENGPDGGIQIRGLYGPSQSGAITFRQSLISGNSGGIFHFGWHSSIITIDSTTISNNDTGSGAGGAIMLLSGGQVVLRNSTVTGHNKAGVAAIDMAQGWISIFDSTIANNYYGVVGDNQGIDIREMQGSILANNLGGACSSPVYYASLYNLTDDDTCGLAGPTNLIGEDPLLLPLTDNGGLTPTHALTPSSPAIDAGGYDCPVIDQRGVSRPQDGDGDGVARCDIGAYEYERPVLEVTLDIKPDGFPNSINPYSRGVIPLAVLGSETFDVANVDVTTLAFGPGGAPIAHLSGHLQDVNYDGITDLVTHYRTRDTGIVCGDESATLTGETLDGLPIEGTDSIQTVGCRASRWPAIWMKDQEREGKPRSDGLINLERK